MKLMRVTIGVVNTNSNSHDLSFPGDLAGFGSSAFSPDGTHIAYRSDRRGGGVYITPTLSGSEELLAAGGFDPKYSPDGSTIAFWRGYVGGALYPKAEGRRPGSRILARPKNWRRNPRSRSGNQQVIAIQREGGVI